MPRGIMKAVAVRPEAWYVDCPYCELLHTDVQEGVIVCEETDAHGARLSGCGRSFEVVAPRNP